MDDLSTTIAETTDLIKRNWEYALLYIGCDVMADVLGFTAGRGVVSIICFLLAMYIECGMLGRMKAVLATGREFKFEGLHASAKKYFFTILGIKLLLGLVGSIPSAVVVISDVILKKSVFVFSGPEIPTWIYVILSLGGSLILVWSICASCYAVYKDEDLFSSLKGGMYAAIDSRRILIFLFLLGPALAIMGKTYFRNFDLYVQFVNVTTTFVVSSIVVFAYASVMVRLKKSESEEYLVFE